MSEPKLQETRSESYEDADWGKSEKGHSIHCMCLKASASRSALYIY